MTNTFLKASVPAMQALAILENNRVFAPLVNTGYVDELSQKVNGYEKGNVIQLKVPPSFTAEIWNGSVATPQGAAEGTISLTVSDLVQVPMALTVSDMTFLMETFQNGGQFTPEFINRVLNPAFEALADYEDAYIASKAAKLTPYYYGTAASTPAAVSDITGIRKVLNNNKCPMSARRLVVNPDCDEKLLQIDTFNEADKSGSTLALEQAMLGTKFGFGMFMDQNIYSHTKGTLAASTGISITLNGALAKGDTAIAFDRGGSSGTLTGTLVAGDILVITDSVSGVVTNVVVTTGGTATANAISATIQPVDRAIADNSTAVVLGSHVANLAFQRDGIFHVNLPSAVAPKDGYIIRNPYNGMGATIRVEGSTIAAKSNNICVEMYIATAIRKECVARLLG